MKVTRKQFLSTLATGLASAAVLKPARLLGEEPGRGLSPDTFLPFLNTTFRVIRPRGGGPVDVVLKNVTRKEGSKETSQFSLEFAAPGGEILEERAPFRFEHPALGVMLLFVVRTKTDPVGQTWYRADFNLLLSKDTAQNNRKTRTVVGRSSE